MNRPSLDERAQVRQALETVDLPEIEHAACATAPVPDGPLATPCHPILGGLIAGTYRLKSVLGAGGMGVVYAAVNERTGKQVALKLLRVDEHTSARRRRESAERFQREARAAGRIQHPNVIDIYDVGADFDTPYIVMPQLHGETLRTRLWRGNLTFKECLAFVAPIIRGLAEAHRRGVIHRDLKPDNIFLARLTDGAEVTPILLDFGVCRLLRIAPTAQEITTLTRYGTCVGTPAYMPLEQLRGDSDVDARADVFALGVILYESLSGRLPFAAINDRELAVKLATEEPVPLHTLLPDLDLRVSAIVHRALSREPKRRFRDASALLAALENSSLTLVSGARTRTLSWTSAGVGLVLLGSLALLLARVATPQGNRPIPAALESKVHASDVVSGSRADQKTASTNGSDMHATQAKVKSTVSPPRRITRSRHTELADALAKKRGTEAALGPIPDVKSIPERESQAAIRGAERALVANAVPQLLDKEYIRDRVEEIVPLIAECYEGEIPDDLRMAGDLKIRFTIEGDPSVGGIVGESKVISGSLARHNNFINCVTETMYTLEFIAPDDEGMVTVEYPFSFARE